MTPRPSAVPPAPLLAPQAYAGLFFPPRLLVLLRWPCRPLLWLRRSLQLWMGLRLPPPTRLCLLRTCATHAWLRSPCRSLGLRWPSLWLSGSHGPLRSSSGLGWPARYSAGLNWPSCYYGFLLQLRCLVRCRSLRGPQPVALRSLNVQRSGLPPFLIVFPPGFGLSTPGCLSGLQLYAAFIGCFAQWGGTLWGRRCHGVRVYVLHGIGCGLLLGVTALALYVSFGSLFYACPSLKCPVGLCYMDTGSD